MDGCVFLTTPLENHVVIGKIPPPFAMHKGPSINYVSIFEGGGGQKMLTDAYVGEGGI